MSEDTVSEELREKRPDGWPENCGNCGAPWTRINYEIVDGFCCLACGGCDSDE